jgi:hypothetical protein
MFNEKIKNEHLNRLSSEDFKTKEKLPVIVVLEQLMRF